MMNPEKQMEKLIEKARVQWNESWRRANMEYDRHDNTIMVWLANGGKAFFDADTLKCIGEKC